MAVEGGKPDDPGREVKKYPGSLRLRKPAPWVTSLIETSSCQHLPIEIPIWAAPTFSWEKEGLAWDNNL